MNGHVYRGEARGSLRSNTQGLTASSGWCDDSSPKHPVVTSLCPAGFWVHTQHCGQADDTQGKIRPPTGISISGFGGPLPHGLRCQGILGVPEWRRTLPASPGGQLLWTLVSLSVPGQRCRKRPLTSQDRWPQVGRGLSLMGCCAEHFQDTTWK